jgi:hypothetical protein
MPDAVVRFAVFPGERETCRSPARFSTDRSIELVASHEACARVLNWGRTNTI